MPAVIDDITASERDGTSGTIVYTTLYDLIAALNDAIAPGEEAWVVPIATHLLRAGHARFLRDVGVEMLGAEEAPLDVPAEALCTPA